MICVQSTFTPTFSDLQVLLPFKMFTTLITPARNVAARIRALASPATAAPAPPLPLASPAPPAPPAIAPPPAVHNMAAGANLALAVADLVFTGMLVVVDGVVFSSIKCFFRGA